MENKTKKTKVDYAAIIREYEVYSRGRSLKQICDDSDYVYPNSFTEKFNGMNLIFLFWLALLLFPMFESFEGFGISIKKRKYDKEKEAITSDFHAQILNAQIKKEQERKEAEHE